MKRLSVVLIAALLLTLLLPTAVLAKNPNPGVLPPNSRPHGLTYGEWSAEWWKWDLALPVDQNPSFDETGCANGDNGQSGHVWFLTGVINVSGTAVRDCEVPAGKALFFPVFNVECSTLEPPPYYGGNEEELRACVDLFDIDTLFEGFANIDGVPVQELDRYLVESPLYNFTVPPNNVLGVTTPPDAGQSVSQGYFLMLAPLSAGDHTIQFGGTYANSFTLNITYNLTVGGEPAGSTSSAGGGSSAGSSMAASDGQMKTFLPLVSN